ncbi:potassium channel subfamily K member 1-like [Brachionichthys hirsutus]|uniref:potassium channel subfamily K member 1-like n=1 Tax=Brachionichthys hirsutus TaxID=412623 RepID=UPI003604B6AF
MARACADARCARFLDRHRTTLNFAALVVGYVVYLLIGARIFSAIELPYENELRRQLVAARRDFLANNTCVSDAHLEELLARVLEASNYGVSVIRNSTTYNWDFVSSLFFASTVLTTTGYGHTVPLSSEGKAFCMFYAIFGIPITLFFLSVTVYRLMLLVTSRPVSYLHLRWGLPKAKLSAAHAVSLAAVVFLLFLVVPAGIFTSLEKDWNFVESLYFCFISLTTIGLGDYVPGATHSRKNNPHPHLYRLAVTVYLILGLVCVLVVLETCCELSQIKRLRQSFYRESVREPDGETANIIDHDYTTDNLTDHATYGGPPTIQSVSQQAASLRQNGKPKSYATASEAVVNGGLR